MASNGFLARTQVGTTERPGCISAEGRSEEEALLNLAAELVRLGGPLHGEIEVVPTWTCRCGTVNDHQYRCRACRKKNPAISQEIDNTPCEVCGQLGHREERHEPE